jgi:DnaA family protein
VTEQLILDLGPVEAPTFDNFVVGRNGETIAALRAFVAGAGADPGFLLWGAPGAGKTHLQRAVVAHVRAAGGVVATFADPGELLAIDPHGFAAHRLVAVDQVDAATPAAQARLFTLFNVLKLAGGRLLACGRLSPAQLPIREDLRTRLGWGAVRELLPLADADKPAALVAYARQRGFGLSDEVIRYLLAHARRDMTALIAVLAALDRQSLATRHPITIPMIREWLNSQGGTSG